MTRNLHPFGPASVVAFMIDGEGPYSLESMLAANAEAGDEDLRAALRQLAPGEVYHIGIGGGWTEIRAVVSPGFTYTVWNDTDGIPAEAEGFDTREIAEVFCAGFRARYAGQGYYKTNAGERIDPTFVELRIVEEAVTDAYP